MTKNKRSCRDRGQGDQPYSGQLQSGFNTPPSQSYDQFQYNQPGYGYPSQSQYQPPPPNSSSQLAYPGQQQPISYGANSEYYGSGSSNAPAPGPYPPADERGVLGALAGGAAGAYAGHKVGHGFIGAAGGAFAGHKLEDAWKHHNEQQKINDSQSPQPQPQYTAPVGSPPSYQDPPRYHEIAPQGMRGNFSASSAQISLDGDHDLIARCRDVNGSEKPSALSLNKVLSNQNGHFEWVHEGGNFGASARNVRLVNDGRALEAELKDINGVWNWARVWLDEKVGNDNGNLVFVK